MSTSKERARAQQGPRTSMKKATKLTPAAEKKTVRSAFHQPTGRDYVKKMTIEIDRDLHAELTVIQVYGTCITVLLYPYCSG